MAPALGRVTQAPGGQHSSRLAGAGDGGSGTVCPLVVPGNLRVWVASVLAHQSGGQGAGRRGGSL